MDRQKLRLLIVLILFGCEPIGPPTHKLTENFLITKEQPKTWKLMTKLGCHLYPILNDVKEIKWNKEFIAAKIDSKDHESNWYIFYSTTPDLNSCIDGKVFRQVNIQFVKKFIKEQNIGKLKTREFK